MDVLRFGTANDQEYTFISTRLEKLNAEASDSDGDRVDQRRVFDMPAKAARTGFSPPRTAPSGP